MALSDDFEPARKPAQEQRTGAQGRLRDLHDLAVAQARQRAALTWEQMQQTAATMPSGLLLRIVSSIVGLPLLILLVFWEARPPTLAPNAPNPYSALPFTAAALICALLAAYELFKALKLRGFFPSETLAYLAVGLLQVFAWKNVRPVVEPFVPAIMTLLAFAVLIQHMIKRDNEPLANLGVTFLGVGYVGWLFSFLVALRSLPGELKLPFFGMTIGSTWGAFVVLYVFAVTWMTDTGAYFTGMRWGRRKLAPRLSPAKTVEGAIGGMFGAGLMSLAWGLWIGIPWYHCVLLGVLLGVMGQMGDLCESALKRDLGIKDFGTLLPGHGGVLDRFDSILFTAPLTYFYLTWFVPR